MGKNSSGSFLRTAIGWVIVVAVAILVFKIAIAVIAGLVQTLFAIVLLAAVAYAVFWALRKL